MVMLIAHRELEHRNGCRHDRNSVIATIHAMLFTVATKTLMDSLSNQRSVPFGIRGVFPRARSMFMRTVTFEMKKFTETGIQICNPPWFLDGQTGTFAMRRNKTVHTSIKIIKFEAVLLQETDNIRISPVSTTTWPPNKYGNTVGNGETCDFFESLP